jgi:hypothetical protein
LEHGDPFHAGPHLGRGAAAQGRVQALPVVEDLDVVEHGRLGLLAGAEPGQVDLLPLAFVVMMVKVPRGFCVP